MDDDTAEGGVRPGDPGPSHDGASRRHKFRFWEGVVLQALGDDILAGGNPDDGHVGLHDHELYQKTGNDRTDDGLRRRGSTMLEKMWAVWVYDQDGNQVKRFDSHPSSLQRVGIRTLTPDGMDELIRRFPEYRFTPTQRANAQDTLDLALKHDPATRGRAERVRQKNQARLLKTTSPSVSPPQTAEERIAAVRERLRRR